MNVDERCQKIELIISDVDGVLTDGRLTLDERGVETKQFHIRDGLAVKLWRKAGHRLGVVTGRSSQCVERRAEELKIDFVRQGVDEKLPVVRQIVAALGISPENVCYIGDDLPDLPVIRYAGLGVAVTDACAEARQAAHVVTSAAGGDGALRELVELILKAQGRWSELMRAYES